MTIRPLAAALAALALAAAPAAAQDAPETEIEPGDVEETLEAPAPAAPTGEEPEPGGPAAPEDEEPDPQPPGSGDEVEDAADPDSITVPLWKGLTFSMEGYYRARYTMIWDLHMFQRNATSTNLDKKMRGNPQWFEQRLRLEPRFAIGDLVALEVWIQALDNVIWGDNAGLSSVGVLAGHPSNTTYDGTELPSIWLPAAWIELNVLVGQIRAGRMPSNWGLGLLTDGGSHLDTDFGWKSSMDVSDRVIFLTMPVAIVQKIAKSEKDPIPVYLGVGYDKLVTDEVGIGPTRIPYNSNWLAYHADDVHNLTVALTYMGEDLGWLAQQDALSAGIYYVYRKQKATNTKLHIFDGYVKLHLGPAFLEAEGYLIRGSSQALPLRPGVEDGPDWLYEPVDADVSAWLIRLGWEWWRFLFKLETGYASGDSKPTNDRFTVRAANQNTIVGLVLYPIALAEITRTRWADEDGLWSKGGIYNSHYFMQTIRFEPIDGLEILVAFIEAWRDKVDGAVIPRHNAGDSKFLGFETDVAVKYHFYRDHAHVGLEFGVLRIGKALEDPMLNMPTNTWTLQLWSAFTF